MNQHLCSASFCPGSGLNVEDITHIPESQMYAPQTRSVESFRPPTINRGRFSPNYSQLGDDSIRARGSSPRFPAFPPSVLVASCAFALLENDASAESWRCQIVALGFLGGREVVLADRQAQPPSLASLDLPPLICLLKTRTTGPSSLSSLRSRGVRYSCCLRKGHGTKTNL